MLKHRYSEIYAVLDSAGGDSIKVFEERLYRHKQKWGALFFMIMQKSIGLKWLKVPWDVIQDELCDLQDKIEVHVRRYFKSDNWEDMDVIDRIAMSVRDNFRGKYKELEELAK
jgi:hypothetical protein